MKRSKLLPFGGEQRPNGSDEIVQRLREAVTFARDVNCMSMSQGARELWKCAYTPLSRERPGLFGKLTGRAEAQTRRLACLYALLDQSMVVDVSHLRAALAVWEFCEQSVLYAFGDSLGERTADAVLTHLRAAGAAGLTRTELHSALGNNFGAKKLRQALELLTQHELVTYHTEPPQGNGAKRVERWIASERQNDPYVDTKYEFNEFTAGGSDVVSDSLMATVAMARELSRAGGTGGIGDTDEIPSEQHADAGARRCLQCGAPTRHHPDSGYILTCACGSPDGRVAYDSV